MTNQASQVSGNVSVPRELTPPMRKAIWDTQHDTCENTWAAVLAAAPPIEQPSEIPVAGGEVQVLGYATRRKYKVGSWLHHSEEVARSYDSTALDCKPANSEIIAVVDIAHVTRLQAEVERLKGLVEEWQDTSVHWMQERDGLQSDLTRARELLVKGGNLIEQMAQAIGSNDEFGDFEAEVESAEKLAGEMITIGEQSAPAAKGDKS